MAADPVTPLNVVLISLDGHLAGAVARTQKTLKRELPGLRLSLHVASEWGDDPAALERCKADIAEGHIILASMLFIEDHISAILPALEARREQCDAMIGCIAAGEVIRLTRLGRFRMDGSQRGPLALLKRLRGSRKSGSNSGAKQLAMLRRLPRILRFIPGTAQDVRAYFLTMQYWLAGSDDNVVNLVRFLVGRYASDERAATAVLEAAPPVEHPDVGLYHPRLTGRMTDRLADLPVPEGGDGRRVGLLLMRSYVLAGDTAHYDGVIEALEARGLQPVPAFAAGLDGRPAVDSFFMEDGRATVDAVVSLTGFSLVGGPAYNDSEAAGELLSRLDVPYLCAHALEFQSLDQWAESTAGLTPVEATMMVAIPELDGATGPMVFGGRSDDADGTRTRSMSGDRERAGMLAARLDRLTALRATPRAERKLAIVLFNFPPNAGATGTAAYLSVFESLHETLTALARAGYGVDLPESVEALRECILAGNAETHGAEANVLARVPAEDHVRRERWLDEIEAQWGPAPGKQQSDGAAIQVLGAEFGNVVVGVQPAFGYEGDPMRLLFEGGFAPTHAFSAFYRYLREDFGANAVLHFGTHGALEFMPGKQAGLSAACWPDRLIGDLPSFYLYAANNPSEGLVAKRRAAATLISYLTPPMAKAGLYSGLLDLKESIERWRTLSPDAAPERAELARLIQSQAAELDLASETPIWTHAAETEIDSLRMAVIELESTLIPYGMHVVGRAPGREERIDILESIAELRGKDIPSRAVLEALADGADPKDAASLDPDAGPGMDDIVADLARRHAGLAEDHEIAAILHALDGGFVPPAPGGDLLRTPEMLPTGRNLHGFDPCRIPSQFAVSEGARQAACLLERHEDLNGAPPRSVALVLWGTDNLKSQGAPIAQALALMGARPRFDGYGRLAGAELIPLEELGRPRIDVLMTLSGIFRDLLPMQTKLLAEAAYFAAVAEEDPEANFVRANALAYQAEHGGSLEDAAVRVFSNADGAYGSNVNQLIDSAAWDGEDELAETYLSRKCFGYARSGRPVRNKALLESALGKVDLAYQNLESAELGVTSIDQYFDTLGGISKAAQRARGDAVPVYIADDSRGRAQVRTLGEQVALETRTRALNPKWYEGMLEHGYEGVRQIEAQVTNTMGWSATAGGVEPWVYQRITQTFMLDETMRERLAALNAKASARLANRLIEASERDYWTPDATTLDALREASEDLEDRLEGISVEAAA